MTSWPIFLLLHSFSTADAPEGCVPTTDNKSYFVDPFIGTGFPTKDGKNAGYGGHTFPGPSYPHGMVNLSPMTSGATMTDMSGYNYKDESIRSFTHVNISGSGWSDGGDLGVMPMMAVAPAADGTTPDTTFPAIFGTGNLNGDLEWSVKKKCRTGINCESWRGVIDKDTENATPGYYEVTTKQDHSTMDIPRITSQLTVGPRIGLHKYHFEKVPSGGPSLVPYLALDLKSRVMSGENRRSHNRITEVSITIEKDGQYFSGSAQCGQGCWRYQYINLYSPVNDDQLPLYPINNGRTYFGAFVNKRVKRVLMSSIDPTQPETVLTKIWDETTNKQVVKTIKCPYVEDKSKDFLCPSFFVEFEEDLTTSAIDVDMAFGVSFVSEAGAKANLTGVKTFEDQCASTMKEWEKRLNKIDVTPHSYEMDDTIRLINFYTALYHSYIHPTLASDLPDADGHSNYQAFDRMANTKSFPAGGKPWTNYTMFSSWDVFRNLAPLMAILEPEETGHFVNSIVSRNELHGGYMAMWEDFGGDSITQIGWPSVPWVTNAWKYNVPNLNLEKMYEASDVAANRRVDSSSDGPSAIGAYLAHGYVPSDIGSTHTTALGFEPNNSRDVSKTLEYSFADYCIAEMAKGLKDDVNEGYYRKRSDSWKNLFNPIIDNNTGGFWPKETNGKFVLEGLCNPHGQNWDCLKIHWIAGNYWGYNYFVPHDLPGLITKYGGSEKFKAHLDHYFTRTDLPGGQGHIDISGWIGAYAHGEESSSTNAWLYHEVNRPDLTYNMVTRIASEFYKNNKDYGYINNDDLGQMSAWLVMSSMGIFPPNVCDTRLLVMRPQFKKMVLTLPNGKKLTLTSGAGEKVISVKQDGTEVKNLISIDYLEVLKSSKDMTIEFITDGGTLTPTDPPNPITHTTPTDQPTASNALFALTQVRPIFSCILSAMLYILI